ncbi:hypothetical protein QBC33DRAFT_301064 [Phialemonium atrogriseum]|uniref:J domain-containing protein n=1 Tax=Phialemonium atrogriseum TaxID=1093897 RepID=A0AAJ0C483_9PEZI|nr:uncharacterized protein QBC33DRAFT_301064 [Phialemonium atrogriseum]KAK1769850.1 hypothetical protein QBC33DRAFT_301064 [Phialemonium atrogriseum]
MRFSALSIGLLALLTPLTSAWSKEDSEIFRLRDEVATHEGPDVTFYDFLGVPPSASQDDISKAYRKKSRSLHPDKVRQQLAAERTRASKAKAREKAKKDPKKGSNVVKQPSSSELKAAIKVASDRQARLSIVTNILRGSGRARYDHFLANGFPAWKGTGYYYNRYRPGLGTVMAGVFLFAGGAAHYLALYMGWKRQREFVERYIRFARHAAWGENLGINIPGVDDQPGAAAAPPPPPPPVYEDENGRAIAVNRKMRRLQERDAKREAAKDAQGSGGRRGKKGGAGASPSGRGSGSATPQTLPQQGAGPTGAKKRVVAENGKVLVVDSLGDVYLEQEDEDGRVGEFLLDPDQLARPTISDTALVRLPIWAYRLTVGRLFPKRDGGDEADGDDNDNRNSGDESRRQVPDENDDDEEDDGASSEPGKHTPSTGSTEDFELLEKSVGDLAEDKAKATGASQKQGKAGKRKAKKR